MANSLGGLTGATYAMLFPSSILVKQYNNFGSPCDQPLTYQFPVEEKADLADITVRGVAVRYVNLGLVSLTVAVIGMFDSRSQTLQLGNPSPSPNINGLSYYGTKAPGAVADGKVYVAFFNFTPLTDMNFQIVISVPANNGPLQLEKVYVIGEGEELSR